MSINTPNKKVISLVANGFQNDNRVQRMAESIQEISFDVAIVGWLKGQLKEREVINNVPVHRIRTKSQKWKRSNKIIGLIQFIDFCICTIRQYKDFDIWHCNDFEAFWIGLWAKLFNPKITLVYDSHEYQKERLGTPFYVKWVIYWVEKLFISKAKIFITVSPGIAKEYQKLYKIRDYSLVRNTPHAMIANKANIFREKFKIRSNQKIFLYQGMVSQGRGIENMIEAFKSRSNDQAVLIIMGQGKIENWVKDQIKNSNIIFHHPYVSYQEIPNYTGSADVGLNTAVNNCLNHYYCLPNKLFEYIQSELPILTNNLFDCKSLVEEYVIGSVIQEYTPDGINKAIDGMLTQDLSDYQQNLKKAKAILHWDEEKKQLQRAYQKLNQ